MLVWGSLRLAPINNDFTLFTPDTCKFVKLLLFPSFVIDLFFLVMWGGEERLYDVIPTKDMVIDAQGDILRLQKGDKCKALYRREEYDAEVVGNGKQCQYGLFSGFEWCWDTV